MLGVVNNPYYRVMRFDKPIPIFLCLFPALYSVTIAANTFAVWLFYTIYCVLGAVVVRSLGCVINDFFDKDLDAQVERTKNRPYAAGELTKVNMLSLIAVLSLFAAILILFLSYKAKVVALCAMPLIVIYPLVKRVSGLAQVVLGFTFQIGALIGWYMVDEYQILVPVLIYAASIFWIMGYDTIYAHQDREDDIAAGVNSMAILLGNRTAQVVDGFYKVMAVLLFLIGLNANLHLVYYFGVFFVVYHLMWQTGTLDINNREDCGMKFRSNLLVGLVLYAAIILGKIL